MPMNPRLLRPLDTGFNPRKIAGLQLWLDGSDSSTFTLNGSNVSEWRDKSGNGRHFAQDTAAQQPVAASNVKNGRGAVAFTNDWMANTATYTVGSFFLVWEHATIDAGDSLPGIAGTRAANASKVANGSLGLVLMAPAPSKVAFDPKPSGTLSARLNGAPETSNNFFTFNIGVDVRTSPNRWQHASLTFAPVSGSKPFVVGADPFGSVRLMQNGHIAEMLLYSGQLSASEVKKVEDYLVRKWGLQ